MKNKKKIQCKFLPLIVPSIGLCTAIAPIISLIIYNIYIFQLEKQERVIFLIKGSIWPSLLITICHLFILLFTMGYIIYNRNKTTFFWRWILTLMLFQGIVVIYYWSLQFLKEWGKIKGK
jgi:hypothetical protein